VSGASPARRDAISVSTCGTRPREVVAEPDQQRLGLEPLLGREREPRLDVRVREVRGLGEQPGRFAVAQHEVVPRQQAVALDAEVAHQRAVHVLRGVERRPLVAELVVGLGLVHVVRAARVRVVVDREEEIRMERIRDPHALGEIAAQRAVGGREVVAVVGARHLHLRAARFEQAAQIERDAEIHLRFGEPRSRRARRGRPRRAPDRARCACRRGWWSRRRRDRPRGPRSPAWGARRSPARAVESEKAWWDAARSPKDGGRGEEDAGGDATRPCARSGPHGGAL
jgi:hypothetical protein